MDHLHQVYGCSDVDFLEQVSLALDVYSSYDSIILARDFNMEVSQPTFKDFLSDHQLKSLVNEPTCYKNDINPSCIDLFLTNNTRCFQNTSTISTGLSDFHKMIVTVMKLTVPKEDPKIIEYREYKHFDQGTFDRELSEKINS